eukprot:scaffold1.g5629.t1
MLRGLAVGSGFAHLASAPTFQLRIGDNDPEYIQACQAQHRMRTLGRIVQKMKERALKGKVVSHDPETPGWCEGLASDAEAVVKAERDHEMPMEEMRRFTEHVLDEEGKQDSYDATGGITEPKSGAMGG